MRLTATDRPMTIDTDAPTAPRSRKSNSSARRRAPGSKACATGSAPRSRRSSARRRPSCFPATPATFTYKPWQRKTGAGGGVGGFLSGGRLFEKIGIHTSSANGRLTPEMAKTLPGDGVSSSTTSPPASA